MTESEENTNIYHEFTCVIPKIKYLIVDVMVPKEGWSYRNLIVGNYNFPK